jgi:hypothetical protein
MRPSLPPLQQLPLQKVLNPQLKVLVLTPLC